MMVNKYLLVPIALSVAGLLVTADAAHAQKGHSGGGHSGVGHSGGGHYYGRPGFGIGIGLYPSYYPYGSYGYDPYYAPRLSYYPAYPAPVVIGQSPALLPAVPAPSAVASNAANIRVVLPDPTAKVWFDGTLTTQGGTERLYHTPTLTAGGNYSYRIRAAWLQNGKEMVQESVAQVTPGQTTVIDFAKPLSEPLPAPK